MHTPTHTTDFVAGPAASEKAINAIPLFALFAPVKFGLRRQMSPNFALNTPAFLREIHRDKI